MGATEGGREPGARATVDFDHHSKEFQDHRHEWWQRLRRQPVAFNARYGGFWVVSGYEQVARVARDSETFTSELGRRDGVELKGIAGVPRGRAIPAAGIAEADRATHQALRRAINPYLLPPAVQEQRQLTDRLTEWCLDQRIESGQIDFVEDLTGPVPAVMTMKLIGLPGDNWRHYAELFHTTVSSRPGAPDYDRAVGRVPAMVEELREEARSRRRQPRDDLLTRLVEIEVDGHTLSDDSVAAVLWNLVGGGLDTTTSLTALTLWHLDGRPDLRRQLTDHPELLGPATEEFLRLFSVNETLTRTVTRDTELDGQKLRAGEVVVISWLSANWDETVFDRPSEAVVDRAPNPHLAFGLGAHRCIGMHLARAMFGVMLRAVLDRLPDYRVDQDRIRFYEGNPLLAGLVRLPATFTPGARTGDGRRPF